MTPEWRFSHDFPTSPWRQPSLSAGDSGELVILVILVNLVNLMNLVYMV